LLAERSGDAVFTIMTWNVENFFQPEPADPADFDAKLDGLADAIWAAELDLLAMQEVRTRSPSPLYATNWDWSGELSGHFQSPHAIRVGWLKPGALNDVKKVIDLPGALNDVKKIIDLPGALSPVQVVDDGTAGTGKRLLRGTPLEPSADAAMATDNRVLSLSLR
jgi:hypothetical protein